MKPWYQSKTIIANFLALAASISVGLGLDLGLTAEVQATLLAGVMAVVNVGLRFKTSVGVE